MACAGAASCAPCSGCYNGEDRRRLVAVLDHKPWAADEGAQWVAAFPWKGGKLEADTRRAGGRARAGRQLPVPGAPAPKEPQPAQARQPTEVERLREQLAAETKERRALQESLDKTSREADTLARLRAERDAAREEAEHARADGERLVNDEYRQRERALAATEEALVRQREAEAARDLAERQLGAARTSHSELEAALAATEAARADLASRLTTVEADRADLEARLGAQGDLESRLEAAEAAQSARKRIAHELEHVRAELAKAHEDADRLRAQLARPATAVPVAEKSAEVDRLERELAAAWADRDRVETELVAARAGRERVEAELIAVRGERKRLERELASAPAPEPARRPLRRAHAAPPASRLAPPREGTALWAVRLVALGMVLLLLIAVALVLSRVLSS